MNHLCCPFPFSYRYPSRFYSLLAAARLHELAPELIAATNRPAPTGHPTVWTVRDEFVEEPAVERGVRLARLGLLTEAMVEFDTLPESSLLASEVALIAEIEAERKAAEELEKERERQAAREAP